MKTLILAILVLSTVTPATGFRPSPPPPCNTDGNGNPVNPGKGWCCFNGQTVICN